MKGGESVFQNEGWLIRTVKGPIAGDADLDEYRRVLSAIVLPEMVFHLNRVELVHQASGTTISFNALDALMGWKVEDLPPLQVRVAEEWRRAREAEIQQQKAVQLTYDWTYTTPYTCTVTLPGAGSPAGSDGGRATPSAGDAATAAVTPSEPAAVTQSDGPSPPRVAIGSNGTDGDHSSDPAPPGSSPKRRACPGGRSIPDFVCSPPAPPAGAAARPGATMRPPPPPPPPFPAHSTSGAPPAAAAASRPAVAAPAAAADGAAAPASAASPSAAASASAAAGSPWQATSEQIDRGLLMERDPILFYDEVLLYESDLDDNGVCAVSVKLRVMRRCWLVLLRCWLRVDGCCVRLRETRLFCRHDRPDKRLEVLQEVKHCEGSFAELRARGAPDEGPAYADADAASQAFQAVAPVGLRLLQTRRMVLPPGGPPPPPPV